MKNKLLVLVCTIILSACTPARDAEDIQTTGFIMGNTNMSEGKVEKYFYYVKDTRTNLCFVTGRLGSGGGQLSHVPCTPEVLALVQNANAVTTGGVNAAPGVVIR